MYNPGIKLSGFLLFIHFPLSFKKFHPYKWIPAFFLFVKEC